jgi:hypothetical protein
MRRLRATSLPLPRRDPDDHGGKPARILWQVLACGSDGCIPVSTARAPCLTSARQAGRVWDGGLFWLAADWPGVDGQPGICVLEVAVEHDG